MLVFMSLILFVLIIYCACRVLIFVVFNTPPASRIVNLFSCVTSLFSRAVNLVFCAESDVDARMLSI